MKKTANIQNAPKGESNKVSVASLIQALVSPIVESIRASSRLAELDKVIKPLIEKLRLALGKTELGRAQFKIQIEQLRRQVKAQKIDGKSPTRQQVSAIFRRHGIEARKSTPKATALFTDEQVNTGSDAVFAFSWIQAEKDPLLQAELALKFANAVARQCGKLLKGIKDARAEKAKTDTK